MLIIGSKRPTTPAHATIQTPSALLKTSHSMQYCSRPTGFIITSDLRCADMRLLLSIALATPVLLASSQSSAQAIDISVVAVPQATPVRVLGFSGGQNSASWPHVLVTNSGDVAVAGYTLTAMITAPCEAHARRLDVEGWPRLGARYESRFIAAGATASSTEHLLSPALLLAAGKGIGASFIHVQVALIDVHFVDGTVWTFKPPNWVRPFDLPLFQADQKNCTPNSGSSTLLSRLSPTAIKPSSRDPRVKIVWRKDSDPPAFRMTCFVEGEHATCPQF